MIPTGFQTQNIFVSIRKLGVGTNLSVKVYFYNILKLLQATEKPVAMPISKLYIYL